MKIKNLSSRISMLIVAMAAMSITMTSCSNSDDKDTTPPPSSPDSYAPENGDEYQIEVGEGMVMPNNDFLNVPSVAGDQNIINTLKSIEGVIDVKAFKIAERYDYYADQIIYKTAYYFNYMQDIDHDDPSKGWFKQQCVLTVAGQDRPTVLHTEGYALYKNNNQLEKIVEPALVSVLGANCLQVEYRYHGWSLPEGYTNKWNYLNARQHSADLHTIVTAIKQSGVVGNGKWLATGVSKNGMTSAHYAYYYPNEMDAYVPFCAPFMLSLSDRGPFSHILTKEAFGENEELMNKVKTAFRTYCGNRELQAQCVQIYRTLNPQVTSTDEDIRFYLLHCLFVYYYNKMMYVPFKKWESMIPNEGDPAQKYYDFLMANSTTIYAEETDDDYNRRQGTVDDLNPDSVIWDAPSLLTRAADAIVERHDPYTVQVCIELGDFAYLTDWVSDLLTDKEKEYFINFCSNPASYGVTYDGGRFVREFLEGMKQSNCHIMFVYGMQDPWTGGQIPDEKMGVNCRKLFINHPTDRRSDAGLHNDYIDQWNASEKNQLFQWLHQLGFLTNSVE